MNERKRALLDDCSTEFAISLEFDDEKSNFVLKLTEVQIKCCNLILGDVGQLISQHQLVSRNHTLQVNRSIEWFQIFLVVGLSVELKYFHHQLLDVLHSY